MKRTLAVMLACRLPMMGCVIVEDQELRDIDVVLDWYPNALYAFMYVAIEKGYCEEEGLKVNICFPSNANNSMIANDFETLSAFLRGSARGFADMKANFEETLASLFANQNEENFLLSETVERQSMAVL